MYRAMRTALLDILPGASPGLTEAQMRTAVLGKLPADLYPGGDKAGWWCKAVQLDLEAKGEVLRETARPLRWHRPTEVHRPDPGRPSRTLADRHRGGRNQSH